jgi:hypothetical protein
VILRREVPPQQPHGSERHRARGGQVEDQREAPAGAGGFDAVAGRIFREPKSMSAITEERPVALGGVERGAGVERGQMGYQLDRCLAPCRRARRGVRGGPDPTVRPPSRGCLSSCALVYHDRFRALGKALGPPRSAVSRSVQPRDDLCSEGAWRGEEAFRKPT